MNQMSYMTRPAGPTGTSRFGGQTEQKKWGDTISKVGEISRIFVGSVEYRTTSCDEIGLYFISSLLSFKYLLIIVDIQTKTLF